MSAGYSGKPLAAKLGFKPAMRVIFVNAPAHYPRLLGELPEDLEVKLRLVGKFDLIHFFATKLAQLQKELPRLSSALEPAWMLWISWPKGSSQIPKDFNETVLRSTVLAEQKRLVDVKVCAVDDDWSGLKFVIRKSHR